VAFAEGVTAAVAAKANRMMDGDSAVIRGSIAVGTPLYKLVVVARDMNII
jgi:hypothetical protein